MEQTLCRDFCLLPEDEQFLNEFGCPWEAIEDGSQWVILHDFHVPGGYNHDRVTVAIRIEEGYPKAELDMVYVYPALARQDGTAIKRTEHTQRIHGQVYQRWSRHRTGQNPWRIGTDSIETHVLLIEDWFAREIV